MTRDKYLENALEQWKIWVGSSVLITEEQIKPVMELLLYYVKPPVKLPMEKFIQTAYKRYMEVFGTDGFGTKLSVPTKRGKQHWNPQKHLFELK